MSLYTTAQQHQQFLPIEISPLNDNSPMVVMYSEKPEPEIVLEMHEEDLPSNEEEKQSFEVSEPIDNIEIVIEELPGVESLDPHMEESFEVMDDTVSSNETLRANDFAPTSDSKKSKKDPKWDWEQHGPRGFIVWVKERIDGVPKHSGYDTAGIERAIAYLEKLDNEISRAMRLDLDGELNADKIEEVRSELYDGITRLHDRLDKVKTKKNSKRKKKSSEEFDFVKQAQKLPTISGIVITVPLLISRIARTCINGTISAGKDIEHTFKCQADYYELTKRERAECIQLIADLGFVMPRYDRGIGIDEDFDPTSTDNFDLASNVQA